MNLRCRRSGHSGAQETLAPISLMRLQETGRLPRPWRVKPMKTATIITTASLVMIALGLAFAPASAAEGEDWCNGLIERDGCVYQQSGFTYACKLWVSGTCVEGGDAQL